MPARISPGKVHTVTKDGECHLFITLDLNITLTTDGSLRADVRDVEDRPLKKQDALPDEDDVELEIPDFISGMKLDFGKDIGG